MREGYLSRWTAAAIAGTLGWSPAAAASNDRQSIDIRSGTLASALIEFARETGAEILFEPNLVSGHTAPPVRARLSRREALSRLLGGSGIGFRERGDSYFLFRVLPPASAAAPPSSTEKRPTAADIPLPEILVVGRRSQNADIRRTENDIQPYKVLTTDEIVSSGRDDVDQVIRSRETSNAHVEIPGGPDAPADTRSVVDLRGLGTSRTLVLVDGRRLPSIPTQRFDVQQANLNGIPLSAIERIETLTGTAGGIYGPGALGGVVNVVLKPHYEGVSLRTTSGITSRLDAATIGFEGTVGFTTNSRRTRVMLAGGMHIADPLRQGDRSFARRQRSLQFANDPEGYLGQRLEPLPTGRFFPASNVVGIRSVSGANLTLDPQFGGASLGSPYTFLPTGLTGPQQDNIIALRENAGRLNLSLPDDLSGTRRFLLPRSSTKSAILNLRQSFGDGVEAYIDGIMLQTDGRYEGSDQETLPVILPDAPTNPFSQAVQVSFPNPGFEVKVKQKLRTHRLTAGIVVQLPGGWSASGDYSLGATKLARKKSFRTLSDDGLAAFVYGEPAQPSYPVLDPLGPWGEFISAVELYRAPGSQLQPLKNRFRSGNLRVGGPLVELGGGPLTGSAQIEWRQERVPEGEETHRYPLNSSPFDVFMVPINTRRQSVSSAYTELRAPLTSDQHPFFLLRDLTLQLALRHDRSVARFPQTFRTALSVIRNLDYPTRSERSAVTYTAGGRFFPLSSLMIRASAATGELPPNIASLETFLGAFQGIRPELADPRRGNRPAGSEGFFEFLFGGLPDRPPERARNLSLGAVLNPSGKNGPRVSVDYSAISVKREPYRSAPGVFDYDEEKAMAQVASALAAESSSPGRVERAALTDEDRALGFTGGVVTSIDGRGLNEGRSRLQIVEVQVDWLLRTGRMGDVRLHGNGTWQPSFKRRASAKAPWVQAAGQADGPLKWRAQAGVDWSFGRTTVGLNAQYFGSYRPTRSTAPPAYNTQIELYQASKSIRDQVYFDLNVARRVELFGRGDKPNVAVVRFGIINLADSSPPITADIQTRGYSYHADPRRRRFHLALSSNF